MSNRSDPMMEVNALWRVPSVPGPCTTSSCVERSIPELARSTERHSNRELLSIALMAHSRAVHALHGVDRPLHTRSVRALGRAPARSEPAFAGVPWAYGVEMRERGHVIVSTSRCVPSCSESPETRNRAADDRPTSGSCRGWANAHANGVVHRLVNIGTRLPGRAV